MSDPKEPATGTTTLNEPAAKAPAEPTPESKLYPEPKAPEPKEPAPKVPEPTPEPKKEEPKPGEPKPIPPAANAPADYESLKLPEGSLLSTEELAEVKKQAKEQGLSLEEAQGVIEVKNASVRSYANRQQQELAKVQQDWRDAWTNDPDYGGDKLSENTELAKRAWDKLADPELKQWAEKTGLGNNNLVMRMMARVGRLMSEDQLIRGSVGSSPKQKSPEEILYGKTTPGTEEPVS